MGHEAYFQLLCELKNFEYSVILYIFCGKFKFTTWHFQGGDASPPLNLHVLCLFWTYMDSAILEQFWVIFNMWDMCMCLDIRLMTWLIAGFELFYAIWVNLDRFTSMGTAIWGYHSLSENFPIYAGPRTVKS